MKRWLAVSVLSALVALSTLAGVHAQGVTQPFTYQGYLRQGGAPLNNPSQSMRFRIYDALTGGTALWDSGALTVNVSNGLFTVQLNPPVSIWTGADRFLEIQVGATTLTPRVRLGATPYANTATLLNMFQTGTTNPDRMVITHSPAFTNWGLQYRDTDDSFHFLAGGTTVLRVGLGGPTALQIPAGAAAGRVLTSDASGNASWQPLPPSATVWAVSGANIYNTNTGNVGIGTTSPAARLDILGGNWDTASTEGDLRIGSATHRLKIGIATGGAGAGHATIAAQGGINMLSLGAGTTLAAQRTLTILGTGNVGIGTIAPTGRLHIEYNSSTTTPTLRLHETEAEFARLEFTNTNTARKWQIAGFIGSAVAADRLNFWNSAAGEILSIRGDGTVVATNPSTADYAFALHGILSSTSPGPWCAAVRGQNNGTGVHGIGVWGSQEGSGYGVYATSVSGAGVYALASATSGITYGVVGRSDSEAGSGVFGVAYASSGPAWGVESRTYSTASNAYGVYGFEPSGGAGHAVYANGTLAATGTKSFQIDHPLSPETHYLNHFCAEGPEPMNAYSGVVSLDSRGEAWVQLPDYFEAINRDPRYTLTPIGAAMPNLHVAVKIQNNRFKIAGGAPGKEVSWRIEAVRNDLWVQRYGYQTEQEKEDAIKGKYLSPELYGQPKERGIHYRPEPEPVPSENGEAVRGTRTGRAP
jgi:hypothetical protein